jgi:hypothetical protein
LCLGLLEPVTNSFIPFENRHTLAKTKGLTIVLFDYLKGHAMEVKEEIQPKGISNVKFTDGKWVLNSGELHL